MFGHRHVYLAPDSCVLHLQLPGNTWPRNPKAPMWDVAAPKQDMPPAGGFKQARPHVELRGLACSIFRYCTSDNFEHAAQVRSASSCTRSEQLRNRWHHSGDDDLRVLPCLPYKCGATVRSDLMGLAYRAAFSAPDFTASVAGTSATSATSTECSKSRSSMRFPI